jgi:bleomycin hydrolase
MRCLFIYLMSLSFKSGFSQPDLSVVKTLLPDLQLSSVVATTPIENQYTSPTCWAFGSNSLFETDFLKRTGKTVDLSEMFIARYGYIDKLRQYLKTKGKTYYAGGGQFRDVLRVIKFYGMVPEFVYPGKARGQIYHDHTNLDTAMKKLADNMLLQNIEDISYSELQIINDTLDQYLGPVPTSFVYAGRSYTPKSFATDYMQFLADDYVELTSFSDQPLYRKFLLNDKYNWAFDSMYNVSLKDMQMVVDSALALGVSVGWEGDVTNQGFDYLKGIAISNTDSIDVDSARVVNYRKEVTERDHMLHIIGKASDKQQQTFYLMKNSWGKTNNLDGYMFMQLPYFKLNSVIVMVHKSALPLQLKLVLGLNN